MRTANATFGTPSRLGRIHQALAFCLLMGLSTVTAFAQDPPGDPGEPGPSGPMAIEDFSVTYMETAPDVWEYTFTGRVVNGSNVTGKTVEIWGGPFIGVATTNSFGQFESIITIIGGPALDVRVYAMVTENGLSASPRVYVDL